MGIKSTVVLSRAECIDRIQHEIHCVVADMADASEMTNRQLASLLESLCDDNRQREGSENFDNFWVDG